MLLVLGLVPVLNGIAFKQQFNELISGKVKQIEIKNRTCDFYNDIINIEGFNSSLLKIGTKLYKGTDIYYIGLDIYYITINLYVIKLGNGKMYTV